MAVCYRHPSRETGVSCSSCGNPICPDCMTSTSVGMRCPACAGEKTKVRTAASLRRATDPIVTYTLIVVCVIVYLAESSGGTSLTSGRVTTLLTRGALDGPDIQLHHQYYRLLTSGFLHLSVTHILFNMVFLYFVGRMLEPAIGRLNFAAVYFASLLAGAFGALLFTPDTYTAGASGAEFGVLGALLVVAYNRGIPIWNSGLGLTLVINVVFSLTISNISIGGHLGGLVGGVICGVGVVQLAEKRGNKWGALAVCGLVAAAAVAGAIAVAGSTGLAPNGLTI